MNMTTLEVVFSAVDSLYFRGSRPHAAAGASALTSVFPPPASTFSGAVRTRLGDALGLDWNALGDGVYHHTGPELDGVDIERLIGTADDTGLLHFGAPLVRKGGEPLYPVPAVLLKAESGLVKMELGNAVHTDLGHVRLPRLPDGIQSAKPLEDCWLSATGMQRFLNGDLPEPEHIVAKNQLVQYEQRLGIGREVSTGTVMSGLLYQTEHLRLEPDVDFTITVTLPELAAKRLLEDISHNPLQRFGGEGRMAELTADTVEQARALPSPGGNPELLTLLTDMLPDGKPDPAPLPGFSATTVEGVACWIELYLLSVASGKPRRIGGWDIRHNRPRPVQSYIPAGSCFYVRAVNATDQLQQLHGKQIGRQTDFGLGTLLCAA